MSKRLTLVGSTLFVIGALLVAQAPTGTISGIVSDESGAVIPQCYGGYHH